MLNVTHCRLSVQVVKVCSSPHITASQTYRPNTGTCLNQPQAHYPHRHGRGPDHVAMLGGPALCREFMGRLLPSDNKETRDHVGGKHRMRSHHSRMAGLHVHADDPRRTQEHGPEEQRDWCRETASQNHCDAGLSRFLCYVSDNLPRQCRIRLHKPGQQTNKFHSQVCNKKIATAVKTRCKPSTFSTQVAGRPVKPRELQATSIINP